MTDMPTFVVWSQSGAYCGSESIDIATRTKDLDLALRTYITSESMKQNGWYAVPVGHITKEKWDFLQTPQTSCTPSRGVGNLCTQIAPAGDSYWWSPVTTMQYGLKHDGDGTIKPHDLINLTSSEGWADMEALFDGAFNCTSNGWADSPSDLVHFNFDGSIDMSCLSKLPMKIECGQECPLPAADGSCHFPFNEACIKQPWTLRGGMIH